MSMKSGASLPKSAYEVLGLAIDLAEQTNAALVIGLIGENVEAAAEFRGRARRSRILAVSGPDFAQARYANDAAAAEAICRAAEASVVLRSGDFAIRARASRSLCSPSGQCRYARHFCRNPSTERLQQVAGSIASALRPSFVATRVRGFFCSNQAVTKHGQATAARLQSNKFAITLPAEARRTDSDRHSRSEERSPNHPPRRRSAIRRRRRLDEKAIRRKSPRRRGRIADPGYS